VRADILARALRPGELLVERELAQRYGISRTPVRTALHQLAQEYLVELRPGHTAVVRQFSLRDFADIFEIRLALEPAAARLAATRHDPEGLATIRERFLGLRLESTPAVLDTHVDLGRALHDFIVEATGNPFLTDAYGRLKGAVAQVRHVTREWYEIEARSYRAHLRIIDALQRGEPDDSAAAMRQHLQETWRGLMDALAPRT
jgi:DNA-binding GntR family transcriptional regulator